METFTLRGIESMLGISRAVLGGLIAAGFVSPTRGKHNEYRFTFQDVVLLRTAYGLRRAHIPARKILRALRHLKETLPSEVPLSGLRISAVGNEVAVQDGAARRQVDSGQLLFDFEIQTAAGSVSFFSAKPKAVVAAPKALVTEPQPVVAGPEAIVTATQAVVADPQAVAPLEDAEAWFRRGSDLEAASPAQAELAYRRAIALAPDYVDPYLNLGVLLCDGGRCEAAVDLYHAGLRHCPPTALLQFNLAVALEDLERTAQALAAYEACLRLEPTLADAHYNAARLHELGGRRSQAIRHYSEYRRLQR